MRVAFVFGLVLLGGCAQRPVDAPRPASALTSAAPEAPAPGLAELSGEEQCQRGELAVCARLALQRARTIRPEAQQSGLQELRSLCDRGLAEACAHWGELSWEGNKAASTQAFERGCSLGSMLACAYQGFSLVREDTGSPRGQQLLKKSCDGGSAEGCTLLGDHMHPAQWGEEEIGTYWALMTRGCQGRVARACRLLGLREKNGDGIPRDAVQSTAHLQVACEERDAEGCTHWGNALEAGHGIASDDRGAARAYGAACDLGDAAGCYWLAMAYVRGLGVSKDTSHAVTLMRTSCQKGDRDACHRIAADSSLEPDPRRRLASLEALCSTKAMMACWVLGERLDWHEAAQAATAVARLEEACQAPLPDACLTGYMAVTAPSRRRKTARTVVPRALSFLERSCQKGEASRGCIELAQQLASGQFVPRDARRGGELAAQLCEQSVPVACQQAADAWLQGDGLPRDEARAAAAYGKACDGERAGACRALARLARQGKGIPKNTAQALELEHRASQLDD